MWERESSRFGEDFFDREWEGDCWWGGKSTGEKAKLEGGGQTARSLKPSPEDSKLKRLEEKKRIEQFESKRMLARAID